MLGSRIPVWDKVSHLPCFCVSSVRMCVCVCVMGIHTYIKSHILYEVYFLQWRMCRSCSLSFLPQSSHILSPLSVLELSHPAVFAAICTFYGTFTCTFSPMCNKRCSFGKNAHWLFFIMYADARCMFRFMLCLLFILLTCSWATSWSSTLTRPWRQTMPNLERSPSQ